MRTAKAGSALAAGAYDLLPAAIADLRGPQPVAEDKEGPLLSMLDHLLRSKLLQVQCLSWRLHHCIDDFIWLGSHSGPFLASTSIVVC